MAKIPCEKWITTGICDERCPHLHIDYDEYKARVSMDVCYDFYTKKGCNGCSRIHNEHSLPAKPFLFRTPEDEIEYYRSVFILPVVGNRALGAVKGDGTLHLIGGKRELGETDPWVTLLREIKEETGSDAFINLIGDAPESKTFNRNAMALIYRLDLPKDSMNKIVKEINNRIRNSDETIIGVCWFRFEENMLKLPEFIERILG